MFDTAASLQASASPEVPKYFNVKLIHKQCWYTLKSGFCQHKVHCALSLYKEHRVTATRSCIDTICLSWWWARCARNM